MVMGDEEYDEPDQLLAGLPERVLLSDFVDSQEPIMNAIAKVRASMTKAVCKDVFGSKCRLLLMILWSCQ